MKSIRIPLLIAALTMASAGAYAHSSGPRGAQQGPDDESRHARMHMHAHAHAHQHGRTTKGAAAAPGGRMFGRLDADRDGAITRAELDAANQRRAQMFDRADANSDGKITRDEMIAMRESMHAQMPQMRGQRHGQQRGPMNEQMRQHRRDGQPGAPAAPSGGWKPDVDYLG